MKNGDLKYLLNENTKESGEKELRDLERLTEKFGKTLKSFKLIDIQGDFVYGCTDHKREHVCSLAEYTRYKKLNLKYKKTVKTDEDKKREEDKKKEEEAYKCFKEHDNSVRSKNRV